MENSPESCTHATWCDFNHPARSTFFASHTPIHVRHSPHRTIPFCVENHYLCGMNEHHKPILLVAATQRELEELPTSWDRNLRNGIGLHRGALSVGADADVLITRADNPRPLCRLWNP